MDRIVTQRAWLRLFELPDKCEQLSGFAADNNSDHRRLLRAQGAHWVDCGGAPGGYEAGRYRNQQEQNR